MVRIDADARKGELRHVGPADESRAGAAQPGDRGRILCGGPGVGEGGRGGPGRLAGDVEQVLDRHGQAGERSRVAALRGGAIGVTGGAAGGFEAGGQKGVSAGRRFGRGDRLLDPGGGARLAGQHVGPGVSQVGAHRSCYNRMLCPGRTNGRMHPSGEAAFLECKDSRTGSFKVLRSAIQAPVRVRTSFAIRAGILEPTFG